MKRLLTFATAVAAFAGSAPAQSPAPKPSLSPDPTLASFLGVEAASPAVPVEVSGGMTAFGLTPFQLRDVPAGDYDLRVHPGPYQSGSSRLRVRSSAAGREYEIGSMRPSLLLRSALLPGYGHWTAGHSWRAASAFAQTGLAGAFAWNAHADYQDALDMRARTSQLYLGERDTELLPARRSALLDAEAVAEHARAERTRWFAVTGWAYGSSLLDLFLDTRPVASFVSNPDGGPKLQVDAQPISRRMALVRGAVHPGSGHAALNRRWRGLAFEALTTASLFTSLELQAEAHLAGVAYESARRDYVGASEDDLASTREAMHAAHAEWSDRRQQHTLAMWTTGAVWLLNLVDVWFVEPVPTQPDFVAPKRLGMQIGPASAAFTARF